jgi:DNA-binding response OmpR family regulator
MRLLLIEDEVEMAVALKSALARYDCILDHVTTLADAQAAAFDGAHDALMLDWRLPDGEGVDLIPRLRQAGFKTPIIMLTAMGEVADRVRGLDLGADDYLVKPFAIEELLARLRALKRRPAILADSTVRIGGLDIDLETGLAKVGAVDLGLPRREALVLQALARRAGRTVLRAALEQAVYGYDDEIASNTLDAHVSRLRRKLCEAGAGVEIHPIRGVGYLLRPTG